jgi:phosphate butyryltransferase
MVFMAFKSLDELIIPDTGRPTRRIVVAAAAELQVMEAIKKACELKIVLPFLIGDLEKINAIAASLGLKKEQFETIDEPDPVKACIRAVSFIKEGNAEILMKGMVPTATLLKAVLNRETGLRKNETLSHIALFQTSHYHKLLGISDAAININPTLKKKVSIIENAVEVMNKLGVKIPKVAIIAPLEIVNDKIVSSVDAAELTRMNKDNQIKNCIIYGPLALDIAISREAADQKAIASEVAGDADILIMPDLNSGNILYKSLVFLSDGIAAAIITGASVPIVLTSRADSEMNKLYSIALAAAL